MSKKRQKSEVKQAVDLVGTDQSDEETVADQDSYDGYYDDVLPPDLDRIGEGMDKQLIQKIAAVVAVVLLIVSMCVLMLYLL